MIEPPVLVVNSIKQLKVFVNNRKKNPGQE
jgi:hypothetical protein